MKRFQFSLERVLRLKKQRERLAELRLMQARQVLDKHCAEVARIAEQLRQTAAAASRQVGSTLPAGSWIAYYQHAVQLERLLQTAEGRVALARKAVEEAAAARTAVTKEVEALLYLRRNQWELHLEARAQEEQNRLDEVSMRRWIMAQGNSGESS